MDITLEEVTIRELTDGYVDNNEEGVHGYFGNLNIRPKYQREFVYKEKQRNAVVETVMRGFPLNTIYWAVNGDNTFEVMDGQQRIISICQFVKGDFSVDFRYFHNLSDTEKEAILNYTIMVYMCEGTAEEKLDWFRVINIEGLKLTDQELRNSAYTGEWLTDAKRHFSKPGCGAYEIGKDYMRGSPIRQDFLEKAISWINNGEIEEYMAAHQNKTTARELWLYFRRVMDWVAVTFPNYRREMKGVEWGLLYNQFKDSELDPVALEEVISALMLDEDVTKKSGIYYYVLNAEEKYLNIRSFSSRQKREAYERQEGNCVNCDGHFELEGMHADHITPWSRGGKTDTENCQMLCAPCNRAKGSR